MRGWSIVLIAALGTGATAQAVPKSSTMHSSHYLPAPPLNFAALVPPPPASGSTQDAADWQAVYAAQRDRTKSEVEQAQHDDQEEDIFVYASVLGDRFRASSLPLTAAFSGHLRGEAATVTPALKARYRRDRPFVSSATVHPVCEKKREPSYPSGHAMVGYLEAFALAQMVPELAPKILQRADQYAHNRVVCGVHFPTDVAASRTAALAEFGALSASPLFQAELQDAAKELRQVLSLDPKSN